MEVVIAGAGPVGLTLALLLHRQGIRVRLYEAVKELRPLGVGINLLPHSVRVLYQLGLAAALDRIAIRTSALHYYNKFGQQIWAEPRGLDAGYKFPQYSIHRGEFQQLLLREVRSALGEESVHTGHRLQGWRETTAGVQIALRQESDAGGPTEITVDAAALIAADGINSTARRILYPAEGASIYGGRVLWRGVSKAGSFLDGRTMFMAGHQDCKFVAYPIMNLGDGRQLINWIAELSVPELKPELQDWNRQVSVERFRAPFAAWKFSWIDIPALIDEAERVYEFPLSDRDPLPRWSFGPMTLIGDAAHPMYPIGSNGASQGILDAERLALELDRNQSPAGAFARYEAERRPATGRIVLLNRQNGPEQVMQLAEERAPAGFADIHAVIPRAELEEIAARYKQTAGFLVADVNRRQTTGSG